MSDMHTIAARNLRFFIRNATFKNGETDRDAANVCVDVLTENTTPANPAQWVSDEEMDKAVVEAIYAFRMEQPGRAYDILHDALTAAIGAGGQAVGEEDALETIERELIDGLEVEISIGAENYTFNHRQLARRILSALSQPHPADERVVEALRGAKAELIRLAAAGVPIHSLGQVETALAALGTAPATADGWRPTHRHKKRGTEYVLLGIGRMQCDWWQITGAGYRYPVDMAEVAIYRSIDDGSLWVRPREEFEDGRFEALAASGEASR